MKIALVDDRPEELKRIYTAMKCELPDAKYFTFSNGESFLETWKKGAYDLVILDMFMDQVLGIDVARIIRKTDLDIRLVFCTTSNEFASESYEVGVNYYLHKPISENSIQRMLQMIHLDNYEENRFIQLPDGQRIVLHNIISSEYYNHSIIIHCKNKIDIQTRMAQKDWEAFVSDYDYLYSCSKGILVNFHQIEKQENGMFLMSDNSQVPISRRKTKEALEAFAVFRFHKMRTR